MKSDQLNERRSTNLKIKEEAEMKYILFIMVMIFLCTFHNSSVSANPRDVDGDGHESARYGGDDCDDHDQNRYPGNTEVCDSGHHDEDCNPETFGYRDADGDGVVDASCCNLLSNGQRRCGTDCDDNNRAIQPASQVCDGMNVVICERGGYVRAACPNGTVCVGQPNGTGVCMVRPQGYIAPQSFSSQQFHGTTPRPAPPPPSVIIKKFTRPAK